MSGSFGYGFAGRECFLGGLRAGYFSLFVVFCLVVLSDGFVRVDWACWVGDFVCTLTLWILCSFALLVSLYVRFVLVVLFLWELLVLWWSVGGVL